MRMIKVDIKTRKRKGEISKFIQQFVDSGFKSVEVQDVLDEYVSIESARNVIQKVINREKYNVYTVVDNGKLYLVHK